jgi:hypothetical protein
MMGKLFQEKRTKNPKYGLPRQYKDLNQSGGN